MKIGTDQYNTFDTMTMDCWNDRVYYEGKEFPAGHFAAEILNFAGAIHDPLLERIAVLTALVDDLSTAEKSKRHDIPKDARCRIFKAERLTSNTQSGAASFRIVAEPSDIQNNQMIIAHIQTHSAVLGNGNGVFYLNAAPAKLVIRCFDVQNHICLQHSLIIRCDRRVIIDLKTQTVTHMVPPVMRDTIAASRLYCNLKQLTGSDAGTGCGDSRLCADTNRIIQTNGFFIRRPNAYRSGQIRCITLIVAPVIKTNQTSTFDRNRLVDGITKCRTFVGSRHAEDILRAVLCRMAAEAVPQVLLCVAGTEILQTGEQCLLSDLRRTCDARYLFLSFNHASLIEYCCAGNRCRGECCKYAGGSFVWHTAGIQSDLHIVGLDQLAKRIEKRL